MKHFHSRKQNRKQKGQRPERRFREKIKVRTEKTETEKRPRVEKEIVVGVVEKTHFGWTLLSTDRRDKNKYVIRGAANAERFAGELVSAEILASSKFSRREVVIKESFGAPDDPKNISMIAIASHGIPHQFDQETLAEAAAARPCPLGHRTDLRDIPLVTIDGADARDFDDAVFAEADGKSGGWHLVVAIADVAHYVKHQSALDRTARERGNSVYFPDRVVPMLPEALSNNLCSLMPKVDRACMAVHLWLDKKGELQRWQFVRGLMCSKARLTYEQVQAAKDGKPDKTTAPLLEKVILPLYGAYKVLMEARLRRGTLELDLPERKVEIAEDGTVKAIKQRERLDSHKLIEEFMIAANVAAASELESKGCQALYRVHDKPNEMKLTSLREFLDTLDISLVPSKQLHPRFLTQILEKVANTPHAQVVNEVMLRSQAQAVYSPENIGHFGLALGKYAHFTSPIRRYADLVVHRGLIRANKLGDDGLTPEALKDFPELAEHISICERRAATAERDAVDRFTTLFLSDKIGAVFPARVSGVARFGLFARLDETGADGIVPFSALPRDHYIFDETQQALIGQRTGRIYQLGQAITVRLEKVDTLTGSLGFEIVEKEEKQKKPSFRRNERHKGRRR